MEVVNLSYESRRLVRLTQSEASGASYCQSCKKATNREAPVLPRLVKSQQGGRWVNRGVVHLCPGCEETFSRKRGFKVVSPVDEEVGSGTVSDLGAIPSPALSLIKDEKDPVDELRENLLHPEFFLLHVACVSLLALLGSVAVYTVREMLAGLQGWWRQLTAERDDRVEVSQELQMRLENDPDFDAFVQRIAGDVEQNPRRAVQQTVRWIKSNPKYRDEVANLRS